MLRENAAVRVMGIDPGLGRTGVAVVDGAIGDLRLMHSVCVETTPHQPDPSRLADLHTQLSELVRAWRPDAAAVERLFFSSNRTTAMQVAQARGVILSVLAAGGVAIGEYAPNQVKEAVAGFGSARKPQVARMVRRLLSGDIHGPDDVADACAIAICHHHRAGLAGRTGARARPGMTPRLAEAVARAQRAAG